MAKNKKECPSCAMMIDNGSDTCPICSYEFPRQAASIKWVAIFLLVVIAFYFLLRMF